MLFRVPCNEEPKAHTQKFVRYPRASMTILSNCALREAIKCTWTRARPTQHSLFPKENTDVLKSIQT